MSDKVVRLPRKPRTQEERLADLGRAVTQMIENQNTIIGFDRTVQKGVDVGIATLIVKLAARNQCTRLILSAGDGDFVDALKFAKEERSTEIWTTGFEGSLSPDLQSHSDRVIWLGPMWDSVRKG